MDRCKNFCILFLFLSFIQPLLAKEYRDEINGFTLSYPDSFGIEAHPHAGMIVADINHRSKTTGLQIRIHKRNNLTFDDYIQWYIEQFLKDMRGIKIIEQGNQTVGSHEAYVVTFNARSRNGYFLKSYLVPDESRFFAFQSGTPYKDRDRMEPILDTIAASFTLE